MSTTAKDTKRELPEGWRWVKLGEVIQDTQAGFACGERYAEGIVQLRMNNLDTRGNFIWDDVLRVPREGNNIEQFLLMPGDVLFNNTNSTELVGKSALFTGYAEPIVYSNHFTRLRTISDTLLPDVLASWLNQQWQQGVFAAICNRWIGQSAVKADKLLNLEIPLPPLPEQRRLAEVLREQMAAVEKARAAAQARLEAVKALPAAFLRQVFPQPGQPLPDGWRWVKLGDVCNFVGGNTLPEHDATSNEQVFCLKVSDLSGEFSDGRYVRGSLSRTSKSKAGKQVLSEGAVVFPKRGGAIATNKKRQLKINACLDPNLMGVQPSTVGVTSDYLFWWFESWDLSSIQSGNTVPQLNQQDLSPLEFPLPPLEDQLRIASVLDEQMAAVEKARTAVEEELNTINTLPAALLRRAFSGEL